jgi:2-haloacid dehalogenase
MMKYTWVVFDADGTLFDYDLAESEALEESFRDAGLTFDQGFTEIYREINRSVWHEFERGSVTQERLRSLRFEMLFESTGSVCDPEVFSSIYLLNLSQHSDLMEGALDVLEFLSDRFSIALLTNGIAEVQRSRLGLSTIGGCFSAVVISGEVGCAKPDPRIFDELFRRMGNPGKAEVLLVGDSLASDIRGGSNYGIDTCWFNPYGIAPVGDPGMTFEICRLDELRMLTDSDDQHSRIQ